MAHLRATVFPRLCRTIPHVARRVSLGAAPAMSGSKTARRSFRPLPHRLRCPSTATRPTTLRADSSRLSRRRKFAVRAASGPSTANMRSSTSLSAVMSRAMASRRSRARARLNRAAESVCSNDSRAASAVPLIRLLRHLRRLTHMATTSGRTRPRRVSTTRTDNIRGPSRARNQTAKKLKCLCFLESGASSRSSLRLAGEGSGPVRKSVTHRKKA